MMPAAERHGWPVAAVWSALAVASVAGFLFAEGLLSARLATSAAIVLAAVKIDLIVTHYMELRWSHRPLRQLFGLWLAAVTILLLTTYWIA